MDNPHAYVARNIRAVVFDFQFVLNVRKENVQTVHPPLRLLVASQEYYQQDVQIAHNRQIEENLQYT
jgi:hypothetical protein